MSRRSQFDIWQDTFAPVKNSLDPNAGMDGCMFETFGPELEHVRATLKTTPLCVWTVLEGDNGKWYVSQGFHHVNRIGYLVTATPFDPANADHARRYAAKDVVYN